MADQWERGTATREPITWICSPGVVELVRSNLAPDFPSFHEFSIHEESNIAYRSCLQSGHSLSTHVRWSAADGGWAGRMEQEGRGGSGENEVIKR